MDFYVADGLKSLARADDVDQVRTVAEYYTDYKACFEGTGNNPGEKTLEDKFFEYEVRLESVYIALSKTDKHFRFRRGL